MVFQCINIRRIPWEVLKTEAGGRGFQHLPRDLANVNAWKNIPIFINQSPYHWYNSSYLFIVPQLLVSHQYVSFTIIMNFN